MAWILYSIVLVPFAGFLFLALAGKYLKGTAAGTTGTLTTGITAGLTVLLGILYLADGGPAVDRAGFTVSLWKWIEVGGLQEPVAFYLDPLSLVFLFVITFVGFLIHLYSVEYMKGDRNFSRFFAYMNLFIGSMLLLVLADNYLFLYLGWEGVGLCSFLLIGFWHREKENNAAARKAFVVTRIGDAALAVGLYLLFYHFGTLNIQTIMERIPELWSPGAPAANAAAILLLAGAAGKSAQIPLQTWLPDAMAGPTPVSALIHSATMVTAGVYLVARSHMVYIYSPAGLTAVAVVGAATLLIAGLSALAQSDIKRVLAYSTISQIGYMFLGLGVGAWSAAIFHFMVHAFFKSLLFLGAGVIIQAMDHEQDMFRMGGLRKKLPLTFLAFLAGSLSLSALPLVTAGFYSKDQILFYSQESTSGNLLLWITALAGVLVTSAYTFRMVFLTFFVTPEHRDHHVPRIHYTPGIGVRVVLVILAFLAITSGFINLPHFLGGFSLFSDLLAGIFPETVTVEGAASREPALAAVSSVLSLTGILVAWLAFRRDYFRVLKSGHPFRKMRNFLSGGFGFDRLYYLILVRPFEALARINQSDLFDRFYSAISFSVIRLNRLLTRTQTGRIHWYLTGVALGAILILTIILAL